jgi:hypothetical protein
VYSRDAGRGNSRGGGGGPALGAIRAPRFVRRLRHPRPPPRRLTNRACPPWGQCIRHTYFTKRCAFQALTLFRELLAPRTLASLPELRAAALRAARGAPAPHAAHAAPTTAPTAARTTAPAVATAQTVAAVATAPTVAAVATAPTVAAAVAVGSHGHAVVAPRGAGVGATTILSLVGPASPLPAAAEPPTARGVCARSPEGAAEHSGSPGPPQDGAAGPPQDGAADTLAAPGGAHEGRWGGLGHGAALQPMWSGAGPGGSAARPPPACCMPFANNKP